MAEADGPHEVQGTRTVEDQMKSLLSLSLMKNLLNRRKKQMNLTPRVLMVHVLMAPSIDSVMELAVDVQTCQ